MMTMMKGLLDHKEDKRYMESREDKEGTGDRQTWKRKS